MEFKVIFLGLLACVLSNCASAPPYEPPASRNNIYAPDTQEGLRENILTYIAANYVDDIAIDIKALSARTDLSIEEILAGLKLDERTSYISIQQFTDLSIISPTGYASIGIAINQESNHTHISEIHPGSPAELAGILYGDTLISISGQAVFGLKPNQIIKRLRGHADTSITVTVRTQDQQPREVTMSRQLNKLTSVTHRNIGGAGYIKIRNLHDNAAKKVKTALFDLQTKTSPALHGLILDLRANTGGLLNQSIKVADLFIAGGEVFTTKGRTANDSERYTVSRKVLLKNTPILVLVNGRTASGAEIVAAALRQRGYALLLGTKTFGAGSIQSVIPLRNGRDGALRVTTQRVYTPNSEALEGNGLEPDIILGLVQTTKPQRTGSEQEDNQLREAINILGSSRYQELIDTKHKPD